MAQHYSQPSREDDPHALPDVEIFYVTAQEFCDALADTWHADALQANEYTPDAATRLEGWYWWTCSPGCLPDSDPVGPFDSEADALADARDGLDDGDDTVDGE